MSNRPKIPVEIERKILWECGHRCTVCGTPTPLERAHIIPWHKSREHKAEDMICLCANCHERADKENWGKEMLRDYKRNPWAMRQNEKADNKIPETSTEVIITIEKIVIDETSQKLLSFAIASILDISSHDVRITSIKKGSVEVTFKLPRKSADELSMAYKRKDPELFEHLAQWGLLNLRKLSPYESTLLKRFRENFFQYLIEALKEEGVGDIKKVFLNAISKLFNLEMTFIAEREKNRLVVFCVYAEEKDVEDRLKKTKFEIDEILNLVLKEGLSLTQEDLKDYTQFKGFDSMLPISIKSESSKNQYLFLCNRKETAIHGCLYTTYDSNLCKILHTYLFPYSELPSEDIVRSVIKTIEDSYRKLHTEIIPKQVLSLEEVLEEWVEAERRIDEFRREMTFLIIDVAGSTKIKEGKDDRDIIYTFSNYHRYVEDIARENNGEVVWSGDGGLCTFQNPDKAVGSAIQIQEGLDDFNKDEKRNRLEKPIMVRIGINTGVCLMDEARVKGKWASEVMDIAGHLQKYSDPGEIRIGEETYKKLTDKTNFKKSKSIDGVKTYLYQIRRTEKGR